MHRVDEQVGRRWRFGLAAFALPVALALALVLPAFASAGLVPLEVEKEGAGEGTVTSSPAGIACGATCTAEYEEGKEVTLTATADSESQFVEWEGCDSQPEGKCKVTMGEWRIVTAVFEEIELPEYTLEITEGGNGEGEWECLVGGEEEFCEERYPAGTHVTIKTTPYEGSKFAGFSGDCSGGTCNLVMDKDHSVTVTFNLQEFTLTLKHNGTGSGTFECELEEGPEPCKAKYPWETTVTVIAIPEPGSEFAKWSGCDKTPKPNLCEVEFEEPRSVLATFEKEPATTYYTLNIKKEGAGTGTVTSEPAGIDCGVKCAGEFLEGSKVTLIAAPSEGSVFKRWGSGASGTCTFEKVCWTTMGSTKTVNVIFLTAGESAPKFKLTVSKSGGGTGTVTSSPAGISCGATCSAEFEEGEGVTLTATPASGSEFAGWSGSGCSGTSTCKVTMSEARSVTATFNLKPTPTHTLTVQLEGQGVGTVASDPTGIQCGGDCVEDYQEGTVVTLTATPAAGSEFKRWSGVEGICALEPVCTTKMGGSKVVKAIFNSTEPAPAPTGEARIIKRVALVSRGRALLVLRCVGGTCRGGLELVARVRKGRKNLVIGTRSFSLASGSKKTIKVRLSGAAMREIARRGRLRAMVRGGGVVDALVRLRSRKKKR